MTDKKSLADADRDRTTAGDPPRTHQSSGRRRWTDVLMHRWPTALGALSRRKGCPGSGAG